MPASGPSATGAARPTAVLAELWHRRSLVVAFARRDVSGRYRSSALGWLWSLLVPLATLLFFSIIFLTIFDVEAPPLGNGDGSSYVAFLFCGLVAWNLFAGLQVLSITTLRSCAALFGKTAFPAWAPVIGAQAVQTMQVLLEAVALLGLLVVLGNVGWTWLLAIPIGAGIVLFGMGVGLIVSVLASYADDVKEIVRTVLTVGYFATPVLYPMSLVSDAPAFAKLVVVANPMSWYVQGMHDVLYSLVAPPAWRVALLLVGGAATFVVGLVVFTRLSRDLTDRL